MQRKTRKRKYLDKKTILQHFNKEVIHSSAVVENSNKIVVNYPDARVLEITAINDQLKDGLWLVNFKKIAYNKVIATETHEVYSTGDLKEVSRHLERVVRDLNGVSEDVSIVGVDEENSFLQRLLSKVKKTEE